MNTPDRYGRNDVLVTALRERELLARRLENLLALPIASEPGHIHPVAPYAAQELETILLRLGAIGEQMREARIATGTGR